MSYFPTQEAELKAAERGATESLRKLDGITGQVGALLTNSRLEVRDSLNDERVYPQGRVARAREVRTRVLGELDSLAKSVEDHVIGFHDSAKVLMEDRRSDKERDLDEQRAERKWRSKYQPLLDAGMRPEVVARRALESGDRIDALAVSEYLETATEASFIKLGTKPDVATMRDVRESVEQAKVETLEGPAKMAALQRERLSELRAIALRNVQMARQELSGEHEPRSALMANDGGALDVPHRDVAKQNRIAPSTALAFILSATITR